MMKDRFGYEYIIKVYDSKIGMEGFLVIDNTVLGPGKGGIRMTRDVNENEVCRLARAMTWKNSLAGIPFGGAKAGIVWRGGSNGLKKKYVQSFARAIKSFIPKKYIAGPDIKTGEKEMRWFVEALDNLYGATGKPKKLGGLPHELGSTGFGVAQATVVAAKLRNIDVNRATIAIDGFGNVGSFAFKYLSKMRANIVAVSDTKGTIYNLRGLEYKKLLNIKSHGQSVTDYPDGKKLTRDELFALKVDILIPASVTDVINEKNKDKIQAKIIVEGANIPMGEDIEEDLFNRGILIVPDFVANAGGVISSYAEYMDYSPKKMFEMVEKRISTTTKSILRKSIKENNNPRYVALKIAKDKIEKKMRQKPIVKSKK